MYNCELFISRKHRADFAEFDSAFDQISIHLYENNVNVLDRTDIASTSRALSAALTASMNKENPAEWYIVTNILNTSDASSFKDSFYNFVSAQENRLSAEIKRHASSPKIKIFSMGDLGNGYKGYCFRIRDKKFVALPSATLCGVLPGDLILEGIRIAEEIFDENKEKYPEGYSMIKHAEMSRQNEPPKKENFIMSFIPHSGDSGARIARKIIVLVAIAAFLSALVFVLLYFVVWPLQQVQTAAEIQTIAYQTNTDATTPEGEPLPEQNWDALKKVNPEIVGWIRMDNTPIDYPVLEHKGDDQYEQYYLKHTYKKEYSDYGSIFVDYRCKQSTKSKNVILHGHNMLNGSMFHELVNYGDLNGNLEYYKKHPVLTFNTPDGDSKWKVISVFKTSTLYAHGEFFNYMQADFNSEAEYMNFVYNMRVRSLFNIPVVCNEDDPILTLSTCSYEFTGFRTVLVARKVRPGEDPTVDVQLATLNNNPLFPDVYYQSRGGTRPDVTTFKTANAKGQVSWYDGDGDLKGSETLTATVAANPTEPPTEKGSHATQPAEITFYTIRFMNYDGSEYDSVTVKEGDPLTFPSGTPTMPEDDGFYYVFREWDTSVLDVNNVTTGADLYPVFDPIAKNP